MYKNLIKFSLIMSTFILSACDKRDDIKLVPAPDSVVIDNGKIISGGDCAPLAPWGFPQHHSGETLMSKQFICHNDFALLYNSSSGVSDWIVEKITKEKIDSNYPFIEDNYRPDPALHDDNAIFPEEYDKTNDKGWVKGIMTGIGDYKYTKKSQSEAYYMTNVGPMDPYMYKYDYSILNKNIRNWARNYGDLYVVTAPIYYMGKPLDYIGSSATGALVVEGNNAKLGETGNARIAVPTHYLKIIFSPKIKQVLVYILPNQAFYPTTIQSYRTTLWNAEQLSGYKFFNQFPESFKNSLYNGVANWPFYQNIEETYK